MPMSIFEFIKILCNSDICQDPDCQIFLVYISGLSREVQEFITKHYKKISNTRFSPYQNLLYYEISTPIREIIRNYGQINNILQMNTKFIATKMLETNIIGYLWIFAENNHYTKCEEILNIININSHYLQYAVPIKLKKMFLAKLKGRVKLPKYEYLEKWFIYDI